MKLKRSPEHKVRIKIGLIFLVVILYLSGLFFYSFSLKKNMDLQKLEMDNSYQVLTKSDELITSIQDAQNILNAYLTSPRRILQLQYDSVTTDISYQIDVIKDMKQEMEKNVVLQDIDSLLQEKNRIIKRLTGLFRSQNPLMELDEKINRYDEIIQDTVVVVTSTDTTRVEKQKKGFWNRVRNVFDPEHAPDTTINITHVEQESRATSRVDTAMYADLKNITEEASKSYASRIQGIEKEVRELLFAEQTISLRISQLTNEFYQETIQIAWNGTENSEVLTQRIFRFAIEIGTLSLLIILIIVFFIINDLNKGQKARADLVKEKKLTEELIESRHKLLLSVSHDVKTPLSSIMGYMEMWDSDENEDDKKRQIRSARNSGMHILNMLTNLLEFSRLQQKTGKLHYSSFNVIELIEDICQMFQPLTDEKSLSLKFENQVSSPMYIRTDHTVLKQILTNIVSNAVKYTLQGGITIGLRHDEQFVFTVTDTGIGMDQDDIPIIFKPFSRMQNPLKAEGSGFGLYVTKGLVDLFNGKIEIHSERGKGTSVAVSLPIEVSNEANPELNNNSKSANSSIQKPASGEIRHKKILLFEDDHSLGNMIMEFLKRKGHKAKLCYSPEEVNGFLRVVSDYDIVFTDMQMEQITGTDILRRVREIDNRIPVWLMTAHGDYTSQRALLEGFSGLIRKPIKMQELLDAVPSGDQTDNYPHNKSEKATEEKFPQLAAMFGNDTDAIKEILSDFVSSIYQDMDALQGLVENEDIIKAQQLCHRIYPFLCQLDADDICRPLQRMDHSRGLEKSAYPEWKEELIESIAAIRDYANDIERNWL